MPHWIKEDNKGENLNPPTHKSAQEKVDGLHMGRKLFRITGTDEGGSLLLGFVGFAVLYLGMF